MYRVIQKRSQEKSAMSSRGSHLREGKKFTTETQRHRDFSGKHFVSAVVVSANDGGDTKCGDASLRSA
jgi:hypothetical protein